jgi:hypothetical protein
MVLPRNLDAALVVVAGGESTQAELRRVVERLEVAPASILGVVINRSAQRLRRLKSSKRGGVRPLRRGDAPPRPRTPQIDIDDAGVAMSTRRTNNGSGRSPRRRTPRSDEPTSMTPALNPVNNEE